MLGDGLGTFERLPAFLATIIVGWHSPTPAKRGRAQRLRGRRGSEKINPKPAGGRPLVLDFGISILSGLAKHGVAGQPKDGINDEVGRTLDEVPNKIEVDPELCTEQRQNE